MPLGADKAIVVERAGRLLLSNLVAFTAAQATSGSDRQSGWVNLAMTGRWEGHPSGAFEFTPEVFRQMVDNFNKSKTPVKFDYEHQTMNGQAGPKPASGHIKKLEMRDNGATLWGFVDWTPKAAELIRGGEYNFCSPVVAFRSVDKRTGQEHGAELLQCALTDDPFLDGQQPIQLSFTAVPMSFPDDRQQTLPVASMGNPSMPAQQPPGLQPPPAMNDGAVPPPSADANLMPADQKPMADPPPPPAPPDKGQADANAIVDQLAQAAGGDRASVIAAITDRFDAVVGEIQKVLAKDGTTAEMRSMSKAPEDEAEKARRIAAIEAGQKDAAIVALTKQVETLAASFSKIQADADARAKREIEAKVDGLIAEGKVEQAKREDAIWLFSTDPARATTIFSTKIVPIATTQAGPESRESQTAAGAGTGTPTLDADGNINERSLSRPQAIAFSTLVDRYNGDRAKATKMFTKLPISKGKEAVH